MVFMVISVHEAATAHAQRLSNVEQRLIRRTIFLPRTHLFRIYF